MGLSVVNNRRGDINTVITALEDTLKEARAAKSTWRRMIYVLLFCAENEVRGSGESFQIIWQLPEPYKLNIYLVFVPSIILRAGFQKCDWRLVYIGQASWGVSLCKLREWIPLVSDRDHLSSSNSGCHGTLYLRLEFEPSKTLPKKDIFTLQVDALYFIECQYLLLAHISKSLTQSLTLWNTTDSTAVRSSSSPFVWHTNATPIPAQFFWSSLTCSEIPVI